MSNLIENIKDIISSENKTKRMIVKILLFSFGVLVGVGVSNMLSTNPEISTVVAKPNAELKIEVDPLQEKLNKFSNIDITGKIKSMKIEELINYEKEFLLYPYDINEAGVEYLDTLAEYKKDVKSIPVFIVERKILKKSIPDLNSSGKGIEMFHIKGGNEINNLQGKFPAKGISEVIKKPIPKKVDSKK